MSFFFFCRGGGKKKTIISLACVASVSVEQSFRRFARAKNGARAKIGRRGWGRGAKETLADKTLDFENVRSPANGARDWLG